MAKLLRSNGGFRFSDSRRMLPVQPAHSHSMPTTDHNMLSNLKRPKVLLQAQACA